MITFILFAVALALISAGLFLRNSIFRKIFAGFGAAFLLAFAVICVMGASRAPFYANGFTLLQSGTCCSATDTTVTNTFTTPYGTLPNVICTQIGVTNTTSNFLVSVSLTNFIVKSGAPNVSNNWVAVGSP